MVERFPISQDGLNKLERDLELLKMVERPRIIAAIAEARAHGDLSENAEYHSARESQGFLEAKIKELEDKIARASIVEISDIKTDLIKYGATVCLQDDDTEESVTYTIVNEYEADISQRKISISSPLSRALIGKKEGGSIELITPRGKKNYLVLSVRYE